MAQNVLGILQRVDLCACQAGSLLNACRSKYCVPDPPWELVGTVLTTSIFSAVRSFVYQWLVGYAFLFLKFAD